MNVNQASQSERSNQADLGAFALNMRARQATNSQGFTPLVAAVESYTRFQKPGVLTMSADKFEQFEDEYSSMLKRRNIVVEGDDRGLMIHGWFVRPLAWESARC